LNGLQSSARELSGGHYGGNLMFENHLIMIVFQKNRVLVKRLNFAFEADAANQKYIDRNVFLLATG
jgi:hypothetical protein